MAEDCSSVVSSGVTMDSTSWSEEICCKAVTGVAAETTAVTAAGVFSCLTVETGSEIGLMAPREVVGCTVEEAGMVCLAATVAGWTEVTGALLWTAGATVGVMLFLARSGVD